jgi:hypothetical protein
MHDRSNTKIWVSGFQFGILLIPKIDVIYAIKEYRIPRYPNRKVIL